MPCFQSPSSFLLVGILVLFFSIFSCDVFISPVTDKIAFAAVENENLEIMLMDADGSNKVNLSNHPSDDFAPCWSPDTKKIAFISDRDGPDGLFVMNNDGTGVKRLTSDSPWVMFNDEHISSQCWSPDGKEIIFTKYYRGAKLMRIIGKNGDDERSFPNANLNLVSDNYWLHTGYPAWSPDGKKIAFEHGVRWKISERISIDKYGLSVVDVDGENIKLLVSYECENDSYSLSACKHFLSHPTWSPDGTKIAFIETAGPFDRWKPRQFFSQQIFSINLDGTQRTKLTDPDIFGEAYQLPSWSPGGRKILFSKREGANRYIPHSGHTTCDRTGAVKHPENCDIYIMDPDGTDIRRLTNQGASWATWSPK